MYNPDSTWLAKLKNSHTYKKLYGSELVPCYEYLSLKFQLLKLEFPNLKFTTLILEFPALKLEFTTLNLIFSTLKLGLPTSISEFPT